MADKLRDQVLCKARERQSPGGALAITAILPDVSRVNRHGGSLCVVIPVKTLELLPFQMGDRVAIRVAGTKLVIERIPLEQLAGIRGEDAYIGP